MRELATTGVTAVSEQNMMRNGNSCAAQHQQLSINLPALANLVKLSCGTGSPLTSGTAFGSPPVKSPIDVHSYIYNNWPSSSFFQQLNNNNNPAASNSPASVFSCVSDASSITNASSSTAFEFNLSHSSSTSSRLRRSSTQGVQANPSDMTPCESVDVVDADTCTSDAKPGGLADFSAFVQVACDTAIREGANSGNNNNNNNNNNNKLNGSSSNNKTKLNGSMKRDNDSKKRKQKQKELEKREGWLKVKKAKVLVPCRREKCVRAAFEGSDLCRQHVNIHELKQSRQYAKKFCRVVDCTRIVVRKGVCKAHGEKCSHPGGCSNFASHSSAKLCVSHGGGKRCKIAYCFNTARSFGLCIAHGGGRKKCSVDGCEKFSQSRGLCCAHGGGTRCSRENCKNSAQGRKGLCCTHGGGSSLLNSDVPTKTNKTKTKANKTSTKTKTNTKTNTNKTNNNNNNNNIKTETKTNIKTKTNNNNNAKTKTKTNIKTKTNTRTKPNIKTNKTKTNNASTARAKEVKSSKGNEAEGKSCATKLRAGEGSARKRTATSSSSDASNKKRQNVSQCDRIGAVFNDENVLVPTLI